MIRLIPFTTLVRQEVFRFWRLVRQTIIPPLITTTLFVLIFGYSLGSRITEISGLSYILFIFPGLIAMAVTNNAFANCSTSIYMARFDHSIDNMIAAPLSPLELVLAVVLGGIVRALIIGTLTLAIGIVLLDVTVHHPLLAFLFLLTSSISFACWGIIDGLRAQTWDSLAITINFVISPLTYLSGIFYSITFLPPLWQKVSLANPLFYVVDGLRFAMTGVSDSPWQLALAVTTSAALILFGTCIYLFRIGWRLVK